MFNDNLTGNVHEAENIALKLIGDEPTSVSMTGRIEDKIYKNGVLVETRVGHNLIVNSFLKLVMCLIKGQTGYFGIQYWAVGSGNPSWDSSVPAPDENATRLVSEIGRVPILPAEISFLDSGFSVTTTPSNIIQISHTFEANDCNGTWREFGIFGGNATAVANSGIMINNRHHAVLTKTNEMVIERTMRFTINLA